MESSPKTISFRADDDIDELRANIFNGKENLHWDEFMEMLFSYIKVVFLKSLGKNFVLLDEILYAIDKVNEELGLEEVKEIASLYNKEEPMTVAKLIRFKYRETPIAFLNCMDVSEDEYQGVSDDELAELILKKFTEEEFKKKAKRIFYIEA